ncbi:MAG: hypothetical protein HZB51_30165 [Chloroflexi bacterium]|nr:hypothetical protein [Chloroflexota bacterium]
MNKKSFLIIGIFVCVAVGLAACNVVTQASAPSPTVALASNSSQPSTSAFETRNHSGGSVDVAVTPQALGVGQPIAFEIAMNTHSVDLSDDMTRIVTLRDDKGKEYSPTAWEGGGPGGHHRSGVIKFAALTSKPRSVELVIKDLAQVSERTFRWELP